MKSTQLTTADRLTRMRRMFDKKRAILAEDYEFFAQFGPVVKPRIKRKRRGK